MSSLRRRLSVFALLGLVGYVLAISRLIDTPRRPALEEMRVAMPRFAQVLLAGGDRYLAANIATQRAQVASTEGLDADQFAIQGRVQADASWFNPAQQDNYYLAAGVLSWNGQLEVAQRILHRAHDSRLMDLWPAFYYGFHEWHYNKKPLEGVRWLRLAAERAPSYLEQVGLLQIASRWASSTDDLNEAIGIVKNMANGTRDQAFRHYLLKRVGRLEALRDLRLAAKSFHSQKGVPPKNLRDLLGPGLLQALPPDPFGEGFQIDPNGVPVVASPLKYRKD